mmetsp:Transcript_47876/g.138473  ORF Transcript_47876/g.138473 Transcript_47876/m.138473 type:complete len:200 (-) Transcript_47876:192-791(-)
MDAPVEMPLPKWFTADVVEKQNGIAASSTYEEYLRPDQMSEADFAELARGMLRNVSHDLQKLKGHVSALEFRNECTRGLTANFAAGPNNAGSMKNLEGRLEVLLRRGDFALSVLCGSMAPAVDSLQMQMQVLYQQVQTLGPKLDSVPDGVLEMLSQVKTVDGLVAELPESPEAEVVPLMRFGNVRGARSSGARSSTSRY